MSMRLSLSIVLFFTDFPVLEKCLKCLFQGAPETAILYIVDNSCSEAYHADLLSFLEPWKNSLNVRVILSPDNRGYGAGHNQVIRQVDSTYHVVLNADVFVDPDALNQAIRFMNNHVDVALLSPAVRGEDGERHYLCRKNPNFFTQFLRGIAPSFIKKHFQSELDKLVYKDHDYNSVIYDVPFLTGCFMFFRTSVLKQIGGFDERYFLYMEDADITREILRVARTAYVPSVKVIHLWKRAIRTSRKHKWYAIKSSFIYFWKWGYSLSNPLAKY